MTKWLVPIISPHCAELFDHLIGGADGDEEGLVDVLEAERAVQLVRRAPRASSADRPRYSRVDCQKCRRGAQRVLEEIADVSTASSSAFSLVSAT